MSKSKAEKLSDVLIGETVMGLLDTDEEITFVAVLQALTEARRKPDNHARVAAYTLAIADVKASMPAVKCGSAGAVEDNTGRAPDGSLPGAGYITH